SQGAPTPPRMSLSKERLFRKPSGMRSMKKSWQTPIDENDSVSTYWSRTGRSILRSSGVPSSSIVQRHPSQLEERRPQCLDRTGLRGGLRGDVLPVGQVFGIKK